MMTARPTSLPPQQTRSRSARARARRRPQGQGQARRALVLAGGFGCLLVCVLGHEAPETAQPAPIAPPPPTFRDFDGTRALATAQFLAGTIGPRPAGSAGERRAAAYLRQRLREFGYQTRVQEGIPLGDGVTANVIGLRPHPGQTGRLLIGAHYDTKRRRGCAGANDNASGVAVTLELARVLADADLPYTLEIAFFGGEEQWGRRSLVGSRAYVARCRGQDLPRAMLCVDMVGRGARLSSLYTGRRGDALGEALQDAAQSLGLTVPTKYGPSGSDHVCFGAAGVPAVWLRRTPDAANHTGRDQVGRLQLTALEESGRLLAQLALRLDPSALKFRPCGEKFAEGRLKSQALRPIYLRVFHPRGVHTRPETYPPRFSTVVPGHGSQLWSPCPQGFSPKPVYSRPFRRRSSCKARYLS